MQEICPPGSVRGTPGNGCLYRDPFGNPLSGSPLSQRNPPKGDNRGGTQRGGFTARRQVAGTPSPRPLRRRAPPPYGLPATTFTPQLRGRRFAPLCAFRPPGCGARWSGGSAVRALTTSPPFKERRLASRAFRLQVFAGRRGFTTRLIRLRPRVAGRHRHAAANRASLWQGPRQASTSSACHVPC